MIEYTNEDKDEKEALLVEQQLTHDLFSVFGFNISSRETLYAEPSHGIDVSNEKAFNQFLNNFDFINTKLSQEANDYTVGCFLQSVKDDQIIDISAPFDSMSKEMSVDDENIKPTLENLLNSTDLKEILNGYKAYIQEEKSLSPESLIIEVIPFYTKTKLIFHYNDSAIEKTIEDVTVHNKPLSITKKM